VLAQLREVKGGEYLVGVRHLVESEGDPGYLDRPAVLEGLRAVADAGLVFDMLVRADQLEAVVRAVRAVENLSVVLDHGGKPVIAGGPGEPWSSHVAELAATSRVDCKLSGLVTEAGPGWTRDAIRPFVDRLLEAFGADRLIFGSDWPVCLAMASFEEVLGLATSSVAHLTLNEQLAVSGTNAQRVYGLAPG
jgi:L-fuconolactonase